MGTLTNLNDVKRALSVGSNVNGTVAFDKNLDDTLISTCIQQASDWFSAQSGVNYYAAPGTLTLDATDTYIHYRKLFFRADVVSVTRIENDGNTNDGTLTSADWVTMPRNPAGYVYGVELKDDYWTYTSSPLGAIRVIGNIGRHLNGQPPDRVHLAVTRLASWVYQTKNNQGSVQFGEAVASAPAEVTNIVQQVLELEREKRLYT